jgi:hypothetical protein
MAARLDHPIAKAHVDVPDDELDVAAAGDRLIRGHALEPNRQVKALGERGSHDDEREAVARACCKRLRGIPRHRRIVFELEQAWARKRVDESLPRAAGAQERRDVGAQVLPHRRAQREHVIGADALG